MNCDSLIKGRYSIREYIKDSHNRVDCNLIKEILDLAKYAPSAGNVQPWKFIVYTKKNKIQKIFSLIQKSHETVKDKFIKRGFSKSEVNEHIKSLKKFELFFKNASAIIFVFCKERNPALEKYYSYLNSYSVYEQTAKLGYVNIQSCAAAIQNILLEISALKLGACWMQVPYFAKEDIIKDIGIVPNCDLIAMIPLGIPRKFPSVKNRKKFEDFAEIR